MGEGRAFQGEEPHPKDLSFLLPQRLSRVASGPVGALHWGGGGALQVEAH